jgi:tetratricopeptide (TPR) repeat protein
MKPRASLRIPASALAVLCLLLSGCAAPVQLPPDAPNRTLELHSVPFHPQERFQCGPAALATVLGAAGVRVTPAELVDEVWIPDRQGALATELAAAARRRGRLAYRIDPRPGALLGELEAGHPVLVMQNLGVSWFPRWHFAVVIGFDPEARTVILRSGTERRRLTPLATFDATWARADRWGLVLPEPGSLPANPDRERLLEAAAALERAGHADVAHGVYARWLESHPSDPAARFGLAVTATALGRPELAAQAYETLLAQRPGDIRALNNLALVRAQQGCIGAARELLAGARRESGGKRIGEILETTAAEIEAAAAGREQDCPAGIAGQDAVRSP